MLTITVHGTPAGQGREAPIHIEEDEEEARPLSDVQRALNMCAALCADTNNMRVITIAGNPYSKSRPRFSRNGRVYVKVEDRTQEERTATFLRKHIDKPLTGNVALGCIFYRPNRQRIDADNMLKHVCDAANGIVYLDDSQVTAVMAIVELDAENPRTVLMIGDHRSTLTRGTDAMKPCSYCANPMVVVGKNGAKRFCSTQCAQSSRGADLSEPIPCKQCEKPFIRDRKAQVLCSPECRTAGIRGRNKSRGKPKSICTSCGKTLTHSRGGRCRECWRSDPYKREGVDQ
jgi:Holliday junction resolvase RusA-like endonuclease